MKQKILIVEDEPAISENISYALETDGFETLCHFDGTRVLHILSDQDIDLVILDIGLPDINGLELCKQIRMQCLTPVIFLTARSEEIDRVVGLEIGADDYVVKPFSPRELSARVKAVLRRTTLSPALLSQQDSFFEINENRHQISWFGQIPDLSKYEFKILKTLINRPGHVFSRDRIMDLVWDEPEVSMDRTVDAHIKNIRAKLKKISPEYDPILTHRGIGYSFKENPSEDKS